MPNVVLDEGLEEDMSWDGEDCDCQRVGVGGKGDCACGGRLPENAVSPLVRSLNVGGYRNRAMPLSTPYSVDG